MDLLTLAFSFAIYGLVKKKVNLGGVESLAAETAIQFLPALGYLLWLSAHGGLTFATEGVGHAALLASTGLVTALPLVCFGAAAIRVPLSTLGLLQYLAPVFQFLLGVLYFGEAMPPERWAGFALVWLALVLLTGDALRTSRRAARTLGPAITESRAATPGATDPTDPAGATGTTGATGATGGVREAGSVASGVSGTPGGAAVAAASGVPGAPAPEAGVSPLAKP